MKEMICKVHGNNSCLLSPTGHTGQGHMTEYEKDALELAETILMKLAAIVRGRIEAQLQAEAQRPE